jgi:aldose 1-epimerase
MDQVMSQGKRTSYQARSQVEGGSPQVVSRPFGTVGGEAATLFTLSNSRGMQVSVTNYGGIVQSILVPDVHGVPANVVLGFDNLDRYSQDPPTYFGALIGRYANRIARGTYVIDGSIYKAPINDGLNSLHGGVRGFHAHVWRAAEVREAGAAGVRLQRRSADGEEGYPGNLDVEVSYLLTAENELVIHYQAITDKPTAVNLTNHSFFNLAGQGAGSIYGHVLRLNATSYTPVDQHLIPTGEMAAVEGTPFDFTTPTAIGARIRRNDPQLVRALGYDHNFVLDRQGQDAGAMVLAASVHDPLSGRSLQCYTTEPGLQLYTGNFLNGSVVLANGLTARQGDAFCLETQHFPDAPNQPAFASAVLRPGETFDSTTIYRFA